MTALKGQELLGAQLSMVRSPYKATGVESIMRLVDEIIELLSAKVGSLTEALLKTKVLLHEIDHAELVPWVNAELNGYGDGDEVPEYRIIRSRVLANLVSMTFRAQSHPLPVMHLDEDERQNLETQKMIQSLAVLEEWATSDDDSGSIQNPLPLEYNDRLGKTLAAGVHIQKAWIEIDQSAIVQILTEVRSRLLDFVLALKDKLPEKVTLESVKSIDAQSIFNNAVLGDHNVIVVGDRNKAKVVQNHLRGNFDALMHELKKYNVPDEDIEELRDAIDQDGPLEEGAKTFGTRVREWMKKMLNKAVEASWQIEINIASTVLADALRRYYG